MELIDLIPEFNLYEEYWKIYTKSDIIEPQYLSEDSVVEKSIIGEDPRSMERYIVLSSVQVLRSVREA